MISEDKITDIFCIADDFCKEFEKEYSKMAVSAPSGRTRRCKRTMSDAEVITVLIAFHFNTYRNLPSLLLQCLDFMEGLSA